MDRHALGLRAKMVFTMVAICLISSITVAGIITWQNRGFVESQQLENVSIANRGFRTLIEQQQKGLETALRFLSGHPELLQALQSGEYRSFIDRNYAWLSSRMGIDNLTLLDGTLTAIYRGHLPERYGDIMDHRPMLKWVREEKSIVSGFEEGLAGFVLRAIGPVLDEEGQLLAILDVGTKLSPAFLDWAYKQVGAHVCVFSGTARVATTLQGAFSPLSEGFSGLCTEELQRSFAQNASCSQKIKVAGGYRFIAVFPIYDPHGIVMGTIMTSTSGEAYQSQLRKTLRVVSLVVLLALLLSVSMGVLVAKMTFHALEMEKKLLEGELRYRSIIAVSNTGAWEYDSHTGFQWCSPEYFAMLGRDLQGADQKGKMTLEEAWISLLHPDDGEEALRCFSAYLSETPSGMYENTFRMRHSNGSWVWIWSRGQTLRDATGAPSNRTVGTHIDITERKKAQEEIEYLSLHDALTGLNNRRFFERELSRLDGPKHLPLTLGVIDVNGLKLTNDAFGHQAGDELLKKVAEVLKREKGQEDRLARIGGDEFGILLPNRHETYAKELALRIQRAVAEEEVRGLPVSVSIGWKAKTEERESVFSTFKAAEDAMYRQKASERTSLRYQSIHLITQTLYAKSPREQEHANRVSALCAAMGQRMGMSGAEVNELATAGMLHDIGKVVISESILDRATPLEPSEWLEIKRHPEVGYSILSTVNEYGPLAECVHAHHERWDGAGYPRGLRGDAIPLLARVITIADSYDAMVTDRPYRKAMPPEAALEEIEACSGFQFDKELVPVFLQLVREDLKKERGLETLYKGSSL